MTLRFAALVSLLVCGLITIFPEPAMRIFTNDPSLVREGAQYLRIICLSYPLFALANTMVVMLRWVEIVKIGLMISCVSLGCNFIFNWIFIFGKLGVPAMGIRGAALATVIARFCELLIAGFYLLRREKKVHFRIRNFFTRDREMAADFVRHSVPIIVGDAQWGNVAEETRNLATVMLTIGALTHLGTCYHAACFTGINRGAGDGKFVMKVDIICGWLVVLPLTFLSAFVWHWPLWAVYLCTRIDQCFKWLIAFIRLRGNKWIKNVTRT